MLNISELTPLFQRAIDLAEFLPMAGEFTSQDVLRLVQRKSILQTISKNIFGNTSYLDFLEKKPELPPSNWGDSHITKTISKDNQGFRFTSKAKMYLVFQAKTESTVYKLIVPIIQENIEIQLYGVLTSAQPSCMLDWIEYGFVQSKPSMKENKWILKFTQSRNHYDFSDIDKFWLMQLEYSVHMTFLMYNQLRLKHTFGEIPNDLLLLRTWGNMIVQALNQSRLEGISIEVDDNLITFDRFLDWSYNNGYSKGATFIREDRNGDYKPDNCKWISYRSATIDYGSRAFLSHLSPEIYYRINGIYYSLTQIISYPITINGETKTAEEWELETNVSMFIMLWRSELGYKNGELLEPIVEKNPPSFTYKPVTIDGVTKTVKEWADESGISLKTLISRLRYGWSEEELLIPPKGPGIRVRNEQ
ncbi:hypothetical protein NDS46_30000 (plasmid) [Paenibacillus thiaminolyticus]|uniref:hypothetical protein n=1 Tax=Paenibacillus thiaminolyticus TaxID=49283 RepID=UPI00232D2FCB|nr:hypothetical protein [Paenibacillus thiaminolyticus]WCF11582.1 hypothetical protein NDS46_30000 [Paenibacillus thiaminolyticus]